MPHFMNGHQVVDHPYHMLVRIIYGEQDFRHPTIANIVFPLCFHVQSFSNKLMAFHLTFTCQRFPRHHQQSANLPSSNPESVGLH